MSTMTRISILSLLNHSHVEFSTEILTVERNVLYKTYLELDSSLNLQGLQLLLQNTLLTLLKLNHETLDAGERKLINDITLLAEAISNRLVLLSSSDLYFEELGKGKRFTQSTVIYLEDWFISNSSDPYLTKAKAHLLSEKTGLTIKQVRNWVSNRRRKFKRNPIEPSLERLLE